MVAQFADISVFSDANIDWQAYKAWSLEGDGISRVAMRSSYGTGYVDGHFDAYRKGARLAGIDAMLIYHYAYPQFNDPQAEADWAHHVIGIVRDQDIVVLDFEEGVSQATAAWAYAWLARQEQNYGGKLPAIYGSSSYIRERLQDARLARYPLWLADWQFTPDARPVCPPPWASYPWLQYTDHATVPGIAGAVDANIYLGGTMIPSGWHDDGVTLTASNGNKVVLGFRDYVLSHNWDPTNLPLENEQHADPLELSNPSLGAGSRQRFRWLTLEYTPAIGVVIGWTGQELIKMEQLLKHYQDIVDQAKKVLSS